MTPKRVLFIRFSAIGDILLVSPLIRLFHESFPQTEIDFLVKQKFSALVEHHPLIKCVIKIPDNPSLNEVVSLSNTIKNKKYDFIFDLQKHWRSYFISWLAKPGRIYRYKKYSFQRAVLVYLKKNYYENIPERIPQRYFKAFDNVDINWKNYKLELFIPKSIQIDFEKKIIDHKKNYLIAVAPGAGRKTKQWPVEYFCQLLKLIQQKCNAKFLLFGNKNEIESCIEIENQIERDVINWCGKTSLLETSALIRKSNLLICNDSGIMHIAAALDLEIVAIFGPTVREFGFFPFSEKSEVIEHFDLKCRPCSYHGTEACPKGHFRCMKEILPEQVFKSVAKKIPKEFYFRKK